MFQSISGRLPKRGRKRSERIDESKMSKQPAPTASAADPCPTVIKLVGRPGTGSLPSTFVPPDHPSPVPGSPTVWITVGKGPTALVVGADGGCLDID